MSAIQKAFDSVNYDSFRDRLIGFCADGASVNMGERGGVKAKLAALCPWLISIWCMPHRYILLVIYYVNVFCLNQSILQQRSLTDRYIKLFDL